MNFKVYLAGPIKGLTYNEATNWRDTVRDSLPSTVLTYSPMRGKQRLQEITSGEKIKCAYEDNPLTSAKGINMRDYFDVASSDAVFVYLKGATQVSIGTVMEIAWARAFNKPVILVMEKEGNIHHHSMLLYPCGFHVETLEEGIDCLKALLLGDRYHLAEAQAATTL
jgi:nucleoside 2-deoxyribosyltransferase